MKWAGAATPLEPSSRRGEGEFRAGVEQLQEFYREVIAISSQNVEIVRQGFEHFLATAEVPWVIFDEAIEVHDHDTPDQGVYRGHAGYARYLADWGAAWSTWTVSPEEFIDAGDCVVAVIRMKAKGQISGIEIDRQDALVYKLHDGKLIRLDYYNDRGQALKAVGLAE
jgi:ketosteroid isomerase-like protein